MNRVTILARFKGSPSWPQAGPETFIDIRTSYTDGMSNDEKDESGSQGDQYVILVEFQLAMTRKMRVGHGTINM